MMIDYILPLTCEACDRGFNRCDQEPYNSTTEDCYNCGPGGLPCEDCCLCFSPIALILDIASGPFRIGFCTYNKCCGVKTEFRKRTTQENSI